MAKRLDSPYSCGERTRYLLKYKNWRRTEMVIGGWKRDGACQGGWLGSLPVGLPELDGALRYIWVRSTPASGARHSRRCASYCQGRRPPSLRSLWSRLARSITYSLDYAWRSNISDGPAAGRREVRCFEDSSWARLASGNGC